LQIERDIDHQTIWREDAIELIMNEIGNLHRIDISELAARHQINHASLPALLFCVRRPSLRLSPARQSLIRESTLWRASGRL
jgi:hypothetical protein